MKSEFVKNVYLLEKRYNIIQNLSGERIFDITYNDAGEVFIEEGCDNYFKHKLTPYECMELSTFFKELAEFLENRQPCQINKVNEKVIDLMGAVFCTHSRPDLEKELHKFETKTQVINYFKDLAEKEIKGE